MFTTELWKPILLLNYINFPRLRWPVKLWSNSSSKSQNKINWNHAWTINFQQLRYFFAFIFHFNVNKRNLLILNFNCCKLNLQLCMLLFSLSMFSIKYKRNRRWLYDFLKLWILYLLDVGNKFEPLDCLNLQIWFRGLDFGFKGQQKFRDRHDLS